MRIFVVLFDTNSGSKRVLCMVHPRRVLHRPYRSCCSIFFWYSEESLKRLAPRSIVIRYLTRVLRNLHNVGVLKGCAIEVRIFYCLSETDSVSGEVSLHSVALEGARDSHVPQY